MLVADIGRKIEEITDVLAGPTLTSDVYGSVVKTIVNKPVIVTVYGPDMPDLTVVDLPGIISWVICSGSFG